MCIPIDGYQTRFPQIFKRLAFLFIALNINASISAQTYDFTVTAGDIDGDVLAGTGANGVGCPGGIAEMSIEVTDAAFTCPGGEILNTTIGEGLILDSITIDIAHTFAGDLNISVISPAGTTHTLANEVGGSDDNFTGTIFRDGEDPITDGAAPFTGVFEAQDGPMNDAFDGEEAEGIWTVQVCDVFNDGGVDVDGDGDLLSGAIAFAGNVNDCPIFCELECPASIIENLEPGECETLITPNPVGISGEGCNLFVPVFPPANISLNPFLDQVGLWSLTFQPNDVDPGFFINGNGNDLIIVGGDTPTGDAYAVAEYVTPTFADGSTSGEVCVTFDYDGEQPAFDNPFLAFSPEFIPNPGFFTPGTEIPFGVTGVVNDGVFCSPITTGQAFTLGIYFDVSVISQVNFKAIEFISDAPDPTEVFMGLALECETTDADGNVVDLAEPQGPGVYTTTCVATDLTGEANINMPECEYTVTVNAYDGVVLSALACNDDVNISVDEACNVEFGADMFLEGGPYSCYSDYVVSIRPFGNENLEFIPVGPIDFSNILGTHEFVVTAPDGNSCWGEFIVEDKLGPEITIEDITVSCIDPAINVAVDATDNCGAVTVNCSDVTVQGSCDTGIDRIITRTCIATDQNGMTSEASATITVTTIGTADINPPVTPIELPCGTGITPEEITEYFNDKIDTDFDGFPDTEINPTNATGLNCPSAEMFERNEGITFGYFNYPSVGCDGVIYDRQVDNNVCNLYTSYSDQEIPACAPGCGGNVKVIRTWTVLDWCTPDATPFTFVQIIKATDTEAPTIEVADDFGISVNPWNCTGDFSLPAPTLLHDLCTSDLTYTVSGPAGTTLLAPNTTANPSDFWIVFGAEKGLASFTYTAADCCGNTSSAVLTVNVYDTTPPVPVATQNIVLNLTTNGQLDENGNAQGFAKLYNVSVDDGSYDGCSAVKIEIRREESPVACGYTGNSTYATNDDFPDAGDTRIDRPDYDPDNGEYVKFCCEDITDVDPVTGIEFGLVPVRMRVFDDGNMNGIFGDWVDADDDGVQDAGEYDNFNETWVTVRVEGKSIASIVCPPDVTLNCDMDYTDPSMIGTATTLALCGSEAVSVEFTPQVDACGIGFVIATYSVEGSDPLISCNQRIDIENSFDPFDPDDITFPRDLPTNPTQQIACNDDVTFAAPTWVAGACDFIGYTEEVDTFFFEVDAATGVASDACFKILRRFTVIDWCVYDATNGEDGLYFGSQTIKITDREAPVFTDCEPVMFEVDGNCMRTSLELTNTAEDNGECSSDWLKWQVFVDTWGDGVVDYEYSSFLPTNDSNLNNDTNGNGINDRYLAPTSSGEEVSITVVEDMESSMYNHLVTWKVTDGCGNVSSCETTFMVVDKKAPTPYCIVVHTALMADPDGDGPLTPMVEIWAKDFDKGAYDNCTEQEDLIFTFGDSFPVLSLLDEVHYFKGEGELATEEEYLAGNAQLWDPITMTSGMVFDCNDRPSVNIVITVTDEKGNSDSCLVFLGIIDNQDGCENAGSKADISGTIHTATGEYVQGTQVNLDALLPEYPRSTETVDGTFAFTNNELFVDYSIDARQNDNPTNGVSTLDLVLIQRHIVGLSELDSPYKLIAADISNDEKLSALDIIELRKVILGVQDEFSAVDSWRFVDSDQVFLDNQSPWPIHYSIEVDDLESNVDAVDMVAIKMGDVNNTYSAVNHKSTDVRSSEAILLSLKERALNQGTRESIQLTTDVDISTQGLQLTLELNGISPSTVESPLLGFGDSHYTIDGNFLVISWSANNLQTIPAGETLFTIVGQVETNTTTGNIISLTDRKLRSEIYVGESLQINSLELIIRDDKGIAKGVMNNKLLQNEPNPFTYQTNISYYLDNSESTVTIKILDIMGKLIYTKLVSSNRGWNTHTILQSDLNANGIYYYQLEAGDFSERKSMILVK